MIEAFSVEQIRAAEATAMAELPEGKLMKRASRALARIAAARLRSDGGHNVVALVGGGNNGGDALYAVARLARRGGWRISCAAILIAETAHESGLAAAEEAGVIITSAADAAPGRLGPDAAWLPILAEADLVLDGITGIGGRPGLSPAAHTVVQLIPDDAYVIAVDVPSGCDADGGPSASCVFADETVTFGGLKPASLLPGTDEASGLLTVVDIGLGALGSPAIERLTFDDVARLWPVPDSRSDKYSRGVLGLVAGSPAYPGAAILTALGALGAGPGMVRYAGPATEAVLAAAPEVVTRMGRVQAWVVGPGVELTDDDPRALAQRERVEQAFGSNAPVLIDAGALEPYAKRCADGLVRGAHVGTLLTPHAGEAARMLTVLVPDVRTTRADVEDDPVGQARRLADLTGATVLLKGSTTLVVSPTAAGRPVRSQADAPAWLATAGAGDVLAGIIGTLLAAGLDVVDAASVGACVHGLAADAANPGGPVRASAVAAAVPTVVGELLLRYEAGV